VMSEMMMEPLDREAVQAKVAYGENIENAQKQYLSAS